MSITFGVTLYSMTNEWLAGKYTLAGMVDEVGRRGIGPGVEVVGYQSFRGFPNRVDSEELEAFREALERNSLTPTCLGGNADIALRKNAWLDTDQAVEYMRPQIELAAELGFPIVRTQIGLAPPVLEKLEPIAANFRIHLGMEVHAPEGPNTPKILETREAYRKIDSEWLGFIPDFSSSMRGVPRGMQAKFREYGLSAAGVDVLVRCWHDEGEPLDRYNRFVEEVRPLGESDLAVSRAMMVYAMFGRQNPDDWREILPQVRHIHGKFYDIEDDMTSPSMDYEKFMDIFATTALPISMSTEWEGHAYADLDEVDAFALVAKHQAMCRQYLD